MDFIGQSFRLALFGLGLGFGISFECVVWLSRHRYFLSFDSAFVLPAHRTRSAVAGRPASGPLLRTLPGRMSSFTRWFASSATSRTRRYGAAHLAWPALIGTPTL